MKELISKFTKMYRGYTSNIEEKDLKKFTAYFNIALTLFGVCFLGLFAIGPTLDTVTNLNKQYDDNQIVYKSLHQKFINLQLLDVQYKTVQFDLDNIYSAIPKNSDIPKLTRQIETIATGDKLKISKFDVSTIEIFPNKKIDPIYSYDFTVDLLGSDGDINKFIADVINFDRIVGIDRIVTAKNQETDRTMTFSGKAFFSPK